jgi:transposase InsO family protein
MGDLHDRVIRAYVTPGHPTAYSAPERVASYFNIPPAKAKEILEHVEGYTLHREYKQPKHYNPYYVHNRRKQVQADLIDVSKLKGANDNVRFLLVLIDIFTKRLWVYPIANKGGRAMKAALSEWLRSIDRPPQKLMTDRGTEFTNAQVQTLLRSHNVEWQASNGVLKACIAERVNKTLQILMYKHLSQRETLRYIDVLPRLVETYNKRGHRTLQDMSPAEADLPENEHAVQAIFHRRYTEAAKRRKSRLPFSVGNLVRVKTEPKKVSSSARAYAEQFHGEYYRIVRINRTLPIALYYLQSVDTGDHIEGGFYANELQRQRGDVYKIEAVLDRRVRGGRRQIFVKWRYFGDNWNEWIDEANVVGAF